MKKQRNLNPNSYAKINLFLDVVSKRNDGFHNIRTIFSEIELHDELSFTLTRNDRIKILTNIDFVSVEDNLIYKVAFFIKQKYNVNYGIEIYLKKNIPIAGGLGGGSSNAAATIKALSKIWELNLSNEEMHKIAAEFGSDINFFLIGGSAIGTNRGELIEPIKSFDLKYIFLVNPGISIPSKEAYDLVNLSSPQNNWQKLIETAEIKYCFNKLEEGISQKYTVIEQIINYLKMNGAIKAILSGSGATIIGFCPDENVAQKFSKHYSKLGFWNTITKTKKGERNGNYRC